MFNPPKIVKSIFSGVNASCTSTKTVCTDKALQLNKAVIVSKLSRYIYEKLKHKSLTDKELEAHLRKRGTDFEKLIHHHDLHKKFEENISNTLRNMGIDVEIVNRYNCKNEHIKEADIVIPVGGDGTFLSAASRVLDNRKPVVGFNSDPNRSEGYLCLPKKYSLDIRGAIERLQQGDFEWLMRSRIRTSYIATEGKKVVVKYLHEQEENKETFQCVIEESCKALPVLALNEVFVGESLSARVSHLLMRLNGSSSSTNLKCSGICISTGTGSTSWHLSINRLPVQSVAELLRLLDIDATEGKNSLATLLSDMYNKNLTFASDDKRMGYTIRDLICGGVWPQPKGIKSRGFAQKIEITSNCYDASLVIDGGVSVNFNDGTIILLEILPEDSLRTVIFKN